MARGGQVNPMTMGPFGAGLNVAGVKEMGGVPLNTEWGKVMEGQVVDPSLIASGGVLGLKRSAQGLGKLFDVSGAKRAMSGAVREGASKAEGSISKMSQAANEEMGGRLGQIQDTGMTVNNLDDVLQKTALEIDPTGATHGVPGSMANEVLKLKSGVHGNPPSMGGPELQARFIDLKDRLGRIGSKAQAVFNNHFNDAIPFDFADVKNLRSSVYSAEEAASPLMKQGILNKIAKGTTDEGLLSQLKSAEKGVPGLNIIENLIKSGKNVGRAQTAQKIGKWVGGGTAGLFGLNELFKVLRGNQ